MSIVAGRGGWSVPAPLVFGRELIALPRRILRVSSVDLVLASIVVLMALTDATMILFHLIFVLLTFDAFSSTFRAFAARSGIFVTLATGELVAAVWAGAVPAHELSEIPFMSAILVGVFVLAHRQSAANRHLRELAQQKSDFTAMVAHELGTPLAAIRALATMLSGHGLDPPAEAETIAHIQSELDVLTTLVSDVRAAAEVEQKDFSLQVRPVSADRLFADGVAFARSLPGAPPVLTFGDASCVVRADAERIGQVLRNLLSNAAKYAPEGSPIELRAECGGERLRIEVADRGPGVPLEDVEHVFQKFARGRARRQRAVPGAGLGLYVSRRIVRAHGAGDLVVRRNPRGGAIFSFELSRVS
jgi:signal transduction histidine kinase